jgi:hypothetical protein
MNIVCNIYYDKRGNEKYSLQLQPHLEIFNHFDGSTKLDKDNEETILDSLFGIGG